MTCGNECDRCRRECGCGVAPPSAGVSFEIDVGEYRRLWCSLPDLPLDVELGKWLEGMVKALAECKEARGCSCVEALAVYCPEHDTIYYNEDRIEEWLRQVAIHTAAAFAYYMSERGSRLSVFADLLSRYFQLHTARDFIEVAAAASTPIALAYLQSHERHHWALGPNAGPEDEATAQGIASAADAVRALWDLVRPGMHDHFHGRPVKDALAPWLAEYAIHVVVGGHVDLQGYNQFPRHLKIRGSPQRPVVLRPPTPRGSPPRHFEVELPFAAVYVDSFELMPHYVVDLGYRIDVANEPQRDGELREVWKCCNRQVAKRPRANMPIRSLPQIHC